MSLCFLGTSHAAHHLREAARKKGFNIVGPEDAALIFVSEDTPITETGRHYEPIVRLIEIAKQYGVPIVLTSQVEPGFSRRHGVHYHQAETLRIKDAEYRASNPDYIVVGSANADDALPHVYWEYLEAFHCYILKVTFEEAEFSKIAVNMTLASQVDNTNRLAAAAAKYGANWENVARVIKHDKRIGPESYLTPGRWQDSPHLMRDWMALKTQI